MRDASPVRVRMVYIARLREAFGSAGETIDLGNASDATVARLLAALRARGGAWEVELGGSRAIRVAVNHAVAKPDDAVRDGDEVALFPPVTGG